MSRNGQPSAVSMASSSTGSPFSTQSTDPSSPDTSSLAAASISADSYSQALAAQAALGKNGLGPLFNPGMKGMRASSPLKETGVQVKTEPGVLPIPRPPHPPSSYNPPSVFRPQTTGPDQKINITGPSAASSRATSVGVTDSQNGGYSGLIPMASRSDPPKRLIEVDALPLSTTPVEEIKRTSNRNLILLQGDPQIINKQRVETAIRVILDLLRAIPPSVNSPPLPAALWAMLPADKTLSNVSLERINAFRGLRLQLGTTTKATAKKQLQAGKTPENEMVYLEAAVYMSGEDGRRVYACKRCRQREHRRRASKDASRKKPNSSGSDTSSSKPNILGVGRQPSPTYITGINPDQYEPHRLDQVVEEPGFDPNRSDWRHEIVLFNSAPEVPIKDGSCVWLPFRVVCYGKCHGEKVGFRIKFTLRTIDGAIIATSTTDPIRITDDHKTDKNAKPKAEAAAAAAPSQPQPAVPRPRKGRASAASSRRQSPAPSDAESVQSVSEAGAMVQKQTPKVRTKPYERPPTHSPAVSIGSLPFDLNLNGNMPTAPRFNRQHSAGSVQSLSSIQPQQQDDPMGVAPSFAIPNFEPLPLSGTISPGALRHPNFNMTPRTSYGFPSSRPHSAASSNVASPINGLRPLSDDMLMNGNPLLSAQQNSLNNAFANLSAVSLHQQQHQESLMLSEYMAEQDISQALTATLDGLFDGSSHASSFNDDASGFSGFRDDASGLFSDSGVVPDSTGMESFLDFSGGEDQGLSQPAFNDGTSPLGGTSYPLLFDVDLSNQSELPSSSNHNPVQSRDATADATLRQLLASFSADVPAQPQPILSHVIPAEGPLAGGVQIAIAGQRFTQGMTIEFGGRVAKTTVISESFCTCELPPGSEEGCVDVRVQGAVIALGQKVEQFRYLGMDKEMMRLALEVRDQYQGSSSDAAYRLAQRVATTHSGNSSDRSSASPMASGPSPTFFARSASEASTTPKEGDDLQTTVTNFLASIDAHAPGSLRRSGAVNTPNKAQQTLLHIATVMGYHRLVRRLVLMGAHLDLQDVNGFTALALASLGGQVACARVLIEAGAAYDRPTAFGEMPLDLAKLGEKEDVEALLLSAVWSTSPGPSKTGGEASSDKATSETSREIDDDNPSSGSDVDDEPSRMQPKQRRMSKKARGKMREGSVSISMSPPRVSPSRSRRPSRTISTESVETVGPAPAVAVVPTTSTPADNPPPYEPNPDQVDNPITPTVIGPSWMSRTLSNISSSTTSSPTNPKLPDSMWNRLPIHLPLGSLFDKAPSTAPTAGAAYGYGWITLPAPSWETLQRMTSPEELKLFTQAMAAQALNAIVQSTGGMDGFGLGEVGSTTSTTTKVNQTASPKGKKSRSRRGSGDSGSGVKSRRGSGVVLMDSPRPDAEADKITVKSVKHDKMLYLFWLPILLFVGFWLVVTALPIATGLCVIYGRHITRAIRHKL